MDLLLLQQLSKACGADSPSGPNLEYDPRYLEMMRLSESHPEVQYGATIVAAQSPDWEKLLQSCLAVAEQTRDLRLGVLLVESLCRTHQWLGLAHGLELLHSWVTQLWDTIHPQWDEDHDPTERLNCLSDLVHEERMIQAILHTPLTVHRTFGPATLRDYLAIAQTSTAYKAKFSADELEQILAEQDPNERETHLKHLRRCQVAAESIERFLVQQFGSTQWSGQRLMDLIARAEQCLKERIVPVVALATTPEHVIAMESSEAQVTTTEPVVPTPHLETAAMTRGADVGTETRTSTRILSRSDATQAIDSICSYFEANEPASPVPLLLQRAKRLIPMSFIEILRELAPNEGQQLLQQLTLSEKSDR